MQFVNKTPHLFKIKAVKI